MRPKFPPTELARSRGSVGSPRLMDSERRISQAMTRQRTLSRARTRVHKSLSYVNIPKVGL